MTVQTTYFLARSVLQYFFCSTGVTQPLAWWVALYPANPGPDGSQAVELAGNGYARQPVAFTTPAGTGDPGSIVNNAEIIFPTATAAWGTVAYWAVYAAAAAGNLLAYAALATPKPVGSGDSARFMPGNLSLQLT